MFDRLIQRGYQIEFRSHARAILSVDFPDAARELESALLDFSVPITEIIASGGGEAGGTQRIRRSLTERGWTKDKFEIRKTINSVERESITHEIDHVRQFERDGERFCLALEIEWNNKDPFFDRDLENFKRLHAEGAISAGLIITRGESLQSGIRDAVLRFVRDQEVGSFDDLSRFGVRPTERQRGEVTRRMERSREPQDFPSAWTDHFVADKFGAATTHWRKLRDRIERGVGNPCPLVLIGLPIGIVGFGSSV